MTSQPSLFESNVVIDLCYGLVGLFHLICNRKENCRSTNIWVNALIIYFNHYSKAAAVTTCARL